MADKKPSVSRRKKAYEVDPLPSARRLAAYEIDPLPGDRLDPDQDETIPLTRNAPQVINSYELIERDDSASEEEGEIRTIRKELFRAKALIQLKEAEATLANYLKVDTETVALLGLDAVTGLIEREVAKARGTDPDMRSYVQKLAPHGARAMLQPMLKKGGKFRVGLKPGYEEIAQKELAGQQPSNPYVETLFLFLKLNTTGYVLVEEI